MILAIANGWFIGLCAAILAATTWDLGLFSALLTMSLTGSIATVLAAVHGTHGVPDCEQRVIRRATLDRID